MKVLDLHCRHNHAFEGWFGSEQDFQSQLQRGLLTCPLCGDAQVSKALSAPRINLGARETPAMASPQPDGAASSEVSEPAQVSMPTAASVLQWARQAAAQAEDVGSQFADEARRIHRGDAPERAIKGQASADQTLQLLEEGVPVLPLPQAATETLH
ncbi:MAG TPA: DUF1178 family protein [Giesbergeria sp.]|jgi:hypothetical protein|nr:DUF1178 family protein [Giesbergeria sp.]HRA13494.1 DUF1178 family protein [Giesbergeria sp.]